jgi:hypothetical protein
VAVSADSISKPYIQAPRQADGWQHLTRRSSPLRSPPPLQPSQPPATAGARGTAGGGGQRPSHAPRRTICPPAALVACCLPARAPTKPHATGCCAWRQGWVTASHSVFTHRVGFALCVWLFFGALYPQQRWRSGPTSCLGPCFWLKQCVLMMLFTRSPAAAWTASCGRRP